MLGPYRDERAVLHTRLQELESARCAVNDEIRSVKKALGYVDRRRGKVWLSLAVSLLVAGGLGWAVLQACRPYTCPPKLAAALTGAKALQGALELEMAMQVTEACPSIQDLVNGKRIDASK